ncbi:uncharacterized protein BO72DRAFT_494035 [Aspergillus fijiensis CBS 313.89]|uniref:Uncharacterized protein n=1 Tax=Aspergillus fijiensis CBS 313.89 TaxID=1448319 RepID=A0A8G1W0A4_9EURO|nr:uncharacterized protein BO72DRAFT_494035 [Aspergillus fijiensis CBS 313.89]RAK79680.1 hypothetical protein BO72DRAFT_494035 [Aspergillus fijiensis CBS 313.89]
MQGETRLRLQGFLKRRLTAAGDADLDMPWPGSHPVFQRGQHLPVFPFIESVYPVEQKKDLADPYFTRNCTLSPAGNSPDDLRARLIKATDMINRHCHRLLEIHAKQIDRTIVVVFTHRSAFDYLSQNADLVAGFAAFPKGHDAFDALCQTMLADLCATLTPSCQEDLPWVDLHISCPWGSTAMDSSMTQSARDFYMIFNDTVALLDTFVAQQIPPQRPERLFGFLASVARIIGAALPEDYDLNLWLDCRLVGKPRAPPLLLRNEDTTDWTPDPGLRRPIRLMFASVFPVLVAYSGIPWRGSDLLPLLPAGEGSASWLTRSVPFSALTLNVIGSAQRQLPRAAAGFIELLGLYWRHGLSLDQPSGEEVIAGTARDLTHWEFFLVEALGMGTAWQEKQRLLPLFALFLWHGGDPRVELEVQLDDQAYKWASAPHGPPVVLDLVPSTGGYHDPRVSVENILTGSLSGDCPSGLSDGSPDSPLGGLFGGPPDGCSNIPFGSLPNGCPNCLFGGPPDGPTSVLFVGMGKKKIELVYDLDHLSGARAMKPLRDRMGNAFSLRELITALFPAKAAATLHKLVDSPLADLSPPERASRMHELEPEVRALLCLETIEDAFAS